MTNEDIRLAVRETLISIGFDVNEPVEAQADMAALRELRALFDSESFKADLAHSHRQRMAYEKIGDVTVTSAITVLVGGLLAALWLGIKGYIFH